MESPHLKAIESHIPALTQAEMLELAAELIERARRMATPPRRLDWEEFRGVLRHGPDPLDFQREARKEWD
ncbi:MAG: hypothetical protein ACO1SV_05420 [Fimbriimonas sp.]